jgi:multisubunit Na+/H+ antiporter MnhB subunit
MKKKNLVALVAAVIVFALGAYAMIFTAMVVPKTYDGSDTDVTRLYQNPSSYDVSDPDGVADIIVSTNLEQTKAQNNVAAVVFDYRGFDTIGESFILLCAISGAHVILHRSKKKEAEE